MSTEWTETEGLVALIEATRREGMRRRRAGESFAAEQCFEAAMALEREPMNAFHWQECRRVCGTSD